MQFGKRKGESGMGTRPTHQLALSVNDIDSTIHTANGHAHFVGEEAGRREDWLGAVEGPAKGTGILHRKILL